MGDTEITLGFIWQKLYAQMHLALVDIKDENNRVDIGFSFPFYQNHSFPMGDVLRVCADSKNRLEILDISKWLKGLEDYIHMGQIKEVPSDIKMYASFTRKQFKSNHRYDNNDPYIGKRFKLFSVVLLFFHFTPFRYILYDYCT